MKSDVNLTSGTNSPISCKMKKDRDLSTKNSDFLRLLHYDLYKICLNWPSINEITAEIIFTDHSYLPPVCSDGGTFSVHTTFALMSFDLSAIPIVCDALGYAIIILTCSILLGHATF